MFYAYKKMMAIWKIVCYSVLAFMLFFGFFGSDLFVECAKIENPDPNGKEKVDKVMIPSQIIIWTIVTVITEVVDNIISLSESKN